MLPLITALQLQFTSPLLQKPQPKPAVVQPAPPPPVTEADNPQHCDESHQWIASEGDFYCIEKDPNFLHNLSLAESRPSGQGSNQNYTTDNLYQPGQCTWYVKNRRPDIPNTWGDATNWLYNARSQGWATGSTPKAGAIGWVYGHVVYIESVHSGDVTISEMNYDYVPYHQRVREASANEFKYIY